MSHILWRPTPFEDPPVESVLRIRDILVRIYGSWSSDPYLWLTDPDADPGDPKTYDVDLEQWYTYIIFQR